jgi:hypothetical protein
MGRGGLPSAAGQKAGWASAWWPGPAEKRPAERERGGHARHAHGAVTACNSRVRQHGGTLTGGWTVARCCQSACRGGTGRAPGKVVGGAAHPNGSAARKQWRSLRTMTFIGGERAPVASGDGGTGLQCRCGRGKVRAASIGENGGGWKGLTVKLRERWSSNGDRRGGGVSSGGSQ